MSALELQGGPKTTDWLSTKLSLSIEEIAKCLENLEIARLVQQSGGKWQLIKQNWTTQTDVPNLLLRQVHREYIQKSLESLEHDPVNDRDITGITMAICKSKLPLAKKMIRNFRFELASVLETTPKDEVYRLNIQLFPLKK